MTTAGICTIGDEILIGQITDTNSAMISRELGKAGIRVTEMISIGDIRQDIAAAAETLLRKNDILIVTGGLGPTKDDVTKSVIYELSGSSSYVTDSRQLEIIRTYSSNPALLDEMDHNFDLIPMEYDASALAKMVVDDAQSYRTKTRTHG